MGSARLSCNSPTALAALSVSPVCPLLDSFSKSNQSCQFAVAIYFFCNVLRLYQILFGGALKSHTQKDEGKDL